MPTEMELTLEQTQQGVSYEVSNIRVNSFTMKMEILLEPTSNKLMVAGNPVKKILLKLNLSDHRSILTDSKVSSKKFPSRKFTRWQSFKMAKRLCLVDDLKLLKITMSNTSSRNKLNPEINDHYNIFTRESQEYELKTRDEA
ncbi:hypothetical protein Tco_1313421 [Tanacetum coccineum]